VRVDAFPEKLLHGHVKSIATVASQGDWMTTDVKTYQTLVTIDDPIENVKPGMNAEVTIMASRSLDNVLAVPVQAVPGSAAQGPRRKCFVLTPEGIEERDVLTGMSTDKMVEIREGLREGEEVVLNPRVLLSEKVRGKAGDKADAASAETVGM